VSFFVLVIILHFYHVMPCRAQLCDATVCYQSVHLSVCCDVQVPRSRRLEYFKNNLRLKVSAWADPNMGDLDQ